MKGRRKEEKENGVNMNPTFFVPGKKKKKKKKGEDYRKETRVRKPDSS